MGAKQREGTAMCPRRLASPFIDRGTEAVSDWTVPPLPPHTRLALTAVTGPASPVAGRIRLRTFTCSFPLESRDAKPLLTVQGEPALSTPPIVMFGLFPASVECS